MQIHQFEMAENIVFFAFGHSNDRSAKHFVGILRLVEIYKSGWLFSCSSLASKVAHQKHIKTTLKKCIPSCARIRKML